MAKQFIEEVKPYAKLYKDKNKLLWDELLKHRGHNVTIVSYGPASSAGPSDVCLECEDCGEVIIDAELYTLQARDDI